MAKAINFGKLPRTININKKVLSAWIYLNADPVANSKAIIANYGADITGYQMAVGPGRKLTFFTTGISGGLSTLGIWDTPTDSVPLTTWVNVVTYYDDTDFVNNVPVMYIAATSQAINEVQAPSGVIRDQTGASLVIGNLLSGSYVYVRQWDGMIFDPRIYDMDNTTLTHAQLATALHNGGTPSVMVATDGLVFQGLNVRDEQLSIYTDNNINGMTVRENCFGSVGTVIGDVTGRAAP